MKKFVTLILALTLPIPGFAAFYCEPTPDGFYCLTRPHYYCVYSGTDTELYCQKPGAPFYCSPTEDGYYCQEKHNNKYYCTWSGKDLYCQD
jgi:hypothetical protein